jgi:hypothetical protein
MKALFMQRLFFFLLLERASYMSGVSNKTLTPQKVRQEGERNLANVALWREQRSPPPHAWNGRHAVVHLP